MIKQYLKKISEAKEELERINLSIENNLKLLTSLERDAKEKQQENLRVWAQESRKLEDFRTSCQRQRLEIADEYKDLLDDRPTLADTYLNGDGNIFLDNFRADEKLVEDGERIMKDLRLVKYDFMNKQRRILLDDQRFKELDARSYSMGLDVGISFYPKVIAAIKAQNKIKDE